MKDRSVILMAGPRADAAYWYDSTVGRFITSSHYTDEPPARLDAWNRWGRVDGLFGRTWTRLLPDTAVYERLAGPEAAEGERGGRDAAGGAECRRAEYHGPQHGAARRAGLVTSSARWESGALHAAAMAGDVAALARLLADGASLEARDILGFTALHVAAAEGEADAVEALCSAGAVVDAPSADDMTPLTLACRRAHLAAVDWLSSAGANLAAEAPGRRSVLDCVAESRSLPLLERLVGVGLPVPAGRRPKRTGTTTATRTVAGRTHLLILPR